MTLTENERAVLKVAQVAAKACGATIAVTRTHGGMREIVAVAPAGKIFRASGAATLVAHHGEDFAYLCNDIAERLRDGVEDGGDWTMDEEP